MRETLHNNAGWVCFRILILPEIFKSQKRFEEDVLCMSGSYTFAPARWTCKKQISVSHSSNKSEIMSLDASLRIDGIPALKLWYFLVIVLRNSKRVQGKLSRDTILFFVRLCLSAHSSVCKLVMGEPSAERL